MPAHIHHKPKPQNNHNRHNHHTQTTADERKMYPQNTTRYTQIGSNTRELTTTKEKNTFQKIKSIFLYTITRTKKGLNYFTYPLTQRKLSDTHKEQ